MSQGRGLHPSLQGRSADFFGLTKRVVKARHYRISGKRSFEQGVARVRFGRSSVPSPPLHCLVVPLLG